MKTYIYAIFNLALMGIRQIKTHAKLTSYTVVVRACAAHTSNGRIPYRTAEFNIERPNSISNGRIQYRTAEFNIERQNSISNGRIQYYHLGSSLVLNSKVISNHFEMYLLFFLSMKEQVINSLLPDPVGKCNPACYPPSFIQIPLGSASWDLDDFGWISDRIALSNRA